jgi:hypothetical protein
MPAAFRTRALAGAIGRVPGLRRLPIFRVLALAEVAMLARRHMDRLDGAERRELVTLVRKGRGRPRNLAPEERERLTALVAKADPKRFAGAAADRLSPVPLPKRLTGRH